MVVPAGNPADSIAGQPQPIMVPITALASEMPPPCLRQRAMKACNVLVLKLATTLQSAGGGGVSQLSHNSREIPPATWTSKITDDVNAFAAIAAQEQVKQLLMDQALVVQAASVTASLNPVVATSSPQKRR